MTRRVRFLGALVAGVALLAAACDQQPTGPLGSSVSPSVSALPQAVGGQGVDQHALGQSIPAFGGFFLDQGVPTVYLTDPSQRGAVGQALSGFLADRGLAASGLQVRQARFSYRQLEGFFDKARTAVFAGPGGVFADLDEANNRVTLGVEDATAQGRVRAAVAQLGLPDGAVSVEVTEPIVALSTTLQDEFHDVPGGVQIHFSNYLCSIGVIAQIGSQLGFITASHCTDHQGGVEGTQYYQPLSSTNSTVVAVETEDPGYFGGAHCYRGRKCRYSDASFAAQTSNSGRTFALGEIAQTNGTPGSLDWNGSYWNITDVVPGNATVGDPRSKVGRTTGYTTGHVTNSCVDTGVQGSNIVLLCQDYVSGNGTLVGGGDSGSNVFEESGSNANDVAWAGGLWGGNSSGTMFVYSPASAIESELGSLDVGAGTPPPTGTLTASITYSCKFADCTFDASGSTGSITSYAWTFSDGGSDSGVTVSHSYAGAGNYTVELTVSDGDSGTSDATTTASITCATKGHKLQCK
jgi:hypothetical protein